MTKNKIKKLVNEWRKERENNGFIIDNDIINLTYWVIVNYCSNIDYDDISIIYDSLEINSEFITLDTIDNYDKEQIEKITNHRFDYVKKQLDNGYFFLLDFYTVNSRGFTEHYDDICLKFKSGYNVL